MRQDANILDLVPVLLPTVVPPGHQDSTAKELLPFLRPTGPWHEVSYALARGPVSDNWIAIHLPELFPLLSMSYLPREAHESLTSTQCVTLGSYKMIMEAGPVGDLYRSALRKLVDGLVPPNANNNAPISGGKHVGSARFDGELLDFYIVRSHASRRSERYVEIDVGSQRWRTKRLKPILTSLVTLKACGVISHKLAEQNVSALLAGSHAASNGPYDNARTTASVVGKLLKNCGITVLEELGRRFKADPDSYLIVNP